MTGIAEAVPVIDFPPLPKKYAGTQMLEYQAITVIRCWQSVAANYSNLLSDSD